MKGMKPSKRFESRSELIGSSVALGACVVLVLAAFAFMVPAVKSGVAAVKENESVYRPAGELVDVRKTPVPVEQLRDIAQRLVVPGIEFNVIDGRPPGVQEAPGIEVIARKVSSMADFAAFRTALDRVMLTMPGAQWEVAKLCAGAACDKGSAAYALLRANRVSVRATVQAKDGAAAAEFKPGTLLMGSANSKDAPAR